MKTLPWLAAAALAAVVVALAVRAARNGAEREEAHRPAPVLPRPTPAAKAAFFFDLVRSGEQTTVRGQSLSTWRVIGEPALVELGEPALDYLLSEERYPAYRKTPNLLANVLRLLTTWPGANNHPRFVPFLVDWLDPTRSPRPRPGANWAEDFRRQIFTLFAQFPHASAVPACVAELTRTKRVHDLRLFAVDILLMTGRADLLRDHLDRLPPTADEPQPDVRLHLLQRLYGLAAPGQPAQRRAQAVALEAFLRGALDHADAMVRILAAVALRRLGREGMDRRLIAEYERHREDDNVAWSALIELVRDGPHDYARRVVRERLRKPDKSVAYTSAVRMALWWQLDEPEVREEVWARALERELVQPLMVLPRFARVDRARVVAFLDREIREGSWSRVQDAVRFATGHPVREVVPALLDRVREVGRQQRPYLYGALAALRAEGVVPLLEAEMDEGNPVSLRDAAATELLNLGEGLGLLSAAIERGDQVVLAALLRRAVAGGAAGVPEPLLGAVLRVLKNAPGEDARLTALFLLRCRGTPEGVLEAMIEAYRREPSRRVAREIERVLVELAHR